MLAIIRYLGLPAMVRDSFHVLPISCSQESCDVGSGRLNFDNDGFFKALDSMRNALGMAANIARAEDINLLPDRHFNFSFDDIGERLVGVHMHRRADARLIMNFQKSHFIALD